jgi:chorismate lyase/3-hydroxybenzoate synthase
LQAENVISDVRDRRAAEPGPALSVGYYRPGVNPAANANALAAVRFGRAPQAPTHGAVAPLCVDVSLDPLNRRGEIELWRASGAVQTGAKGRIRFSCDDHFLFGAMECDEREFRGVAATAEAAYAEILRFQRHCGYPYLVRMWNYLDAITRGEGDLERYRQFCVGRGRVLGQYARESFPAASAIGRLVPTHQLQICWIAARLPGAAIENPRQVSAYRYPRSYGPVSPSFSRATLISRGPLLISGTASIVGHASEHREDARAQVEEILRNLAALSALAPVGKRSVLKIYVRNPAHSAEIEETVQRALPDSAILMLGAEICRRELLVEIEAVQLAPD